MGGGGRCKGTDSKLGLLLLMLKFNGRLCICEDGSGGRGLVGVLKRDIDPIPNSGVGAGLLTLLPSLKGFVEVSARLRF